MTKKAAREREPSKRPVGRPAKHRKLVGLMLPPETDDALARAARALDQTKSDFVLQAIEKQLPKPLRRRFSKRHKLRLWPAAFVRLSPEQIAELRRRVNDREAPLDDLILKIVERFLEDKRRER